MDSRHEGSNFIRRPKGHVLLHCVIPPHHPALSTVPGPFVPESAVNEPKKTLR